MLTSTMTLH